MMMSSNLGVVVDLGSSQTRVLWSVDGGEIAFDWFSSDCSLPTSSQNADTMSRNNYFLECGKASYVVGACAANSPLSENLREKIKVEGAIPKVLAALHSAISKSGIDNHKLNLVVLLPFNERKHFKLLERALCKHLKRFRCNGVSYDLNVNYLECLSEGCGLLRYFTEFFPSLEQQSILTVMVGYRDLTLITSRGSEENVSGRTARLGFLWMLKDMEEQIGEFDRFLAARLLFQLGDGSIRAQDLQGLACTTSPELRSHELKEKAKAARNSRKKYQAFIKSMFDDIHMHKYDAVLLGGGTGHYLFPFLNQTLSDKLMPATPLAKQIMKALGCDEAQAARLTDVYAVAKRQAKSMQLATVT
ncbi:MAG: ParM/StbA family protein [Synechococcus sp.]